MTYGKLDQPLPGPLQGLDVAQIGILVPDLAEGVRQYSKLLGVDDWAVYSYGPDNVEDLTYRGDPAIFSMRLALVGSGPQVELIESLTGPSIYDEWIDEHGYGMHHLGFRVPSIDDAVMSMDDAGVEAIQTGRRYGVAGDGGFAYYDAIRYLGLVAELIEVPSVRRPSETLP